VPNPQQDLSVYGTEGTVLGRNVTRPNLEGRVTVMGRSGTTALEVSTAGPFVATVANFADAVLQGRDPSLSGRDGLRSVQVTEALARSVREQRTVRLGT